MILNFSKVEEIRKSFSVEEVLSLVDQKTIYEYYLGQPIKFNSYILSPFRKENNPSFKFSDYKGGIFGKDWATGEVFNCFQFIQKKYNLTFDECINVIVTDFNLEKNGNNKINRRTDSGNICTNRSGSFLDNSISGYEKPRKKEFRIQEQPFTKTDLDYWGQFEISIENLLEFNVVSCKQVWLDDKLIKFYTNNNPIFAYKFQDFDNISYKIYSPLAEKRYKWLFSGTPEDLEGFDQLPWLGDILILTKSLKDVICLKNLEFSAISLQGEQNTLSYSKYCKLKSRFKEIIVFYDNDETGVKCSNRIANIYHMQEIFIPIDLGCKDISEVVKMYGLDYAKDLINSLI